MLFVALLGVTAVGCSGGGSDEKDVKKNDRTVPTTVKLDGLESKPPESWQDKGQTGGPVPRIYNFSLSAVPGDSAPAIVYITEGGGGEIGANVKRWKGQFDPPEGKTIEDVSKLSDIKIGDRKGIKFEVSGDFKGGPGPMTPGMRNAREIAIEFQGSRNRYYIIFRGPEATFEKHRKEFDEWLKNFK
jgi:hypothetical protein